MCVCCVCAKSKDKSAMASCQAKNAPNGSWGESPSVKFVGVDIPFVRIRTPQVTLTGGK